MVTIEIDLSFHPGQTGSLTAFDDNRQRLLGPLPVRGRALCNGEGGVPPGQYELSRIYPMTWVSADDITRFGRFGIICVSRSHSDDTPATEEVIYIHGGSGEASRSEYGIADSLYLSDTDMHQLTALLRLSGAPRITVSGVGDRKDSAVFAPIGTRTASAVKTFVKSLPLALAAIPGLGGLASVSAVAQDSCYDSGSTYSSIDFNTVLNLQGGDALAGYVPSSSSGVTIAGGLDLGIYTSAQLESIGFNSHLVGAWGVYLASTVNGRVVPLVGSAASAVLKAHPLSISIGVAQSLDGVYYPWAGNQIGSLYNAAVAQYKIITGTKLSSLPMRYQTAMMGMYITNSSFQSSSAFALFAQGQWKNATAAMRTYGNSNPSINKLAHLYADYVGKSKEP